MVQDLSPPLRLPAEEAAPSVEAQASLAAVSSPPAPDDSRKLTSMRIERSGRLREK
jgi:hypothetical protein